MRVYMFRDVMRGGRDECWESDGRAGRPASRVFVWRVVWSPVSGVRVICALMVRVCVCVCVYLTVWYMVGVAGSFVCVCGWWVEH